MVELVYAKKCILPSAAANVLQSLHMAEAFGLAGAKVCFFPGVRGKGSAQRQKAFEEALCDTGIAVENTKTWHFVPANHAGVYGLRFRFAVCTLLFCLPKALFFARDISEAMALANVATLTRRKPKFIFEMHEVLHCQPQNAAKAEALRRAEERVLAASAGLVVINPALEHMARDIFRYEKPILVESSAYAPSLFKEAPLFGPANLWPGDGGALQLVYLGRFHEGKGVENLVAAMEYLPESVRLRVIGGSPVSRFQALREQALAIPGGGRRIDFTGLLSQKDAAKACVGAHIFVIPQSDETFFSPLKLYEALALGLPILATPLDIFSEQREKKLVATALGASPRELAEGVMALARDEPLARTLRENALEAARTATWEARARRILDFCASI